MHKQYTQKLLSQLTQQSYNFGKERITRLR